MAALANLVTAWWRHLLRRPEEITPFKLEDGAQMVGDPTSPEGARIEGGGVHVESGVDVKVEGSKAVFRMAPFYPVVVIADCSCSIFPPPPTEGANCFVVGHGTPVLVCTGSSCCAFLVLANSRLRLSGIG
jgi:hypothetical protein